MSSLVIQVKKWLPVVIAMILITGCKDESTETKQNENTEIELVKSIPFAYVERSLSDNALSYDTRFNELLNDSNSSPLDLHSPYSVFLGAKLKVRTGLAVDAIESEVLSQYFGSSEYDVKDLNVSPNGKQLIFAARGADNHPTDNTWNIYTYNFESKLIERVIRDHFIANSGQDTNPVFTYNGQIIFSSDRDAGDPANPRENIELVGDLCEKVDPIENPSLLHQMDLNGQGLVQLTYGTTNHDLNPTLLEDGRVAFIRWQRSLEAAASCDGVSGTFKSSFASGLNRPNLWSQDSQCSLMKQTKEGAAIVKHHYQLLTFDPLSRKMQQLYRTSTMDNSEAAFVALDHLLQAENGNLVTLVRHQFNPVLGGALLELQPEQGQQTEQLFSEYSPKVIANVIDLYPNQLSVSGWYSAVWPYRDGTSRMLVSWAQCALVEQGVNRYCNASDVTGDLDLSYGIWVYDALDDSQLPVVRARKNKVFSEVAISQPMRASALALQPFDANFVDNADGTQIVCHFPNNPPVANAGEDQNGLVGQTFSLNGSASSDADGDILVYQWTVADKPDNSSVTLNEPNSVTPNFVADVAGVYQIQLVVSDDESNSEPDLVNIRVVNPNLAPTANAGADQSLSYGNQVQLDGSNSTDPDGDTLTYRWMITNAPAQSTVILSNAADAKPTFIPDYVGNYQIQLIVNDGQTDSAPDTVNVSIDTPPNQKPLANAGSDLSGQLNQTFVFDGSASLDPDGDTLSYQWNIQSKPADSNAILNANNQVKASLIADVAGTYVVQLIVNDGQMDSDVDTALLTVVKNNTPPTANAGNDQSALTGELITFDGGASFDAEGDDLTYSWVLLNKPQDSSVTLNNAASVKTSFIADVAGEYTVQLIVNDGEFNSVADTAIATAANQNAIPVADAGIDLAAAVGDSVTLDGSRSSDPDGDPLTYHWVILNAPDQSQATLSDATVTNPAFTADLTGNYQVQLIVNDGQNDSSPDTVNISVDTPPNQKPFANAGADQSGEPEQTFTFDGSASNDPDGDPLSYQWSIQSKPANSKALMNNATQVSANLIADVEGDYVIQLIVNDGQLDSDVDTVLVSVIKNNTAPIADAGADKQGLTGDTIVFDGSASSDVDGDNLTYRWTLVSKPQGSVAVLNNSTNVKTNLVVDVAGDYSVELVVSDGEVNSSPDVAFATINQRNEKPTANAGNDLTTTIGSLVTLDGSQSSDPDNDPLTYQWSILNKPSQSSAELTNSSSVNPSFTPDYAGNYQIQLVVNDGNVDSAPDTVNVRVDLPPNQKPIANAGDDLSGNLGDTFTLDGSASRDPDGDSLTYQWRIQSKPANSSASLYSDTQVASSLTPDVAGVYVIQLIVNDGQMDSDVDVAVVTVVKNNEAPTANAGNDHQGFVGDTLIFDGSASSDPDGDSLMYRWTLVSKPQSSSATLNNSASIRASLVVDVAGDYNVQLIVNDGEVDSTPDSAVAIIEDKNVKPIADAGIDLAASVGDVVSLDGSRSSDPDGDPLTYRWLVISSPVGSSAILTDTDKVNPKLEVDMEGEYTAQLIVNDGTEDSDADKVNVVVSQANTRPVAMAGDDQSVDVGALVSLNGSNSYDPDGDTLAYQWVILQKPADSNAVLSMADTVSPNFAADVAGDYQLQLVVSDGNSNSQPDEVIVTAVKVNNPPVANAGADQPYVKNKALQLDGSASSDQDGDPLTYTWSVISPNSDNIQLSSTTEVAPTVVISDLQTYVLQLVVNDGEQDSAPDTVELTPQNTRPVANAGADFRGMVDDTLTFDGSASSDLDGDTLIYEWRVIALPNGSQSSLSDDTLVNPAMTFDVAGEYLVELRVSDGLLWSEADRVKVTIELDENSRPCAYAGDDQSAYLGEEITLNGLLSSDPDGDALTYRWSILHKPDGSAAVLSDPQSGQPKLTIDVAGEYVVQLIVNDGELDSQPDTVMITTNNMRPVADAGNNQSVEVNTAVILDGSNSYDSDGDSLSYRWSLLSSTSNNPPVINNPTGRKPEITPTESGTYIYQLIVNDGLLDSQPDSVTIEVTDEHSCDVSGDTQRVLPVTIRDFTANHPDFEYNTGVDYGLVRFLLGEDGLPVYANPHGGTDTTTGPDNFNQWYRDVPGVNLNIQKSLLITREDDSTIWEYSNSSFFPIDGEGFGNSGLTNPDHNFHFTLETHLSFDYKGGEVFTFRGDDDLWLFINGRLAIDIGGVHSVIERTIDLDELAELLNIEVGKSYTFDLFFAERHTTQSNFMFQTNMELECE